MKGRDGLESVSAWVVEGVHGFGAGIEVPDVKAVAILWREIVSLVWAFEDLQVHPSWTIGKGRY